MTVVGSGASAVHFARTLLDRGHEVVCVDVGRAGETPPRPDLSFEALKRELPDPVAHFLGADFESVTWPGEAGEYYGFPPGKRHVFDGVEDLGVRARGLAPLLSVARGGLSEAWTGGAFPWTADEIADFPFGWDALMAAYGTVAARIGIAGADDAMARHFPVHAHLLPPLDLDEHSRLLLARAARHGEWLARRLRCTFGRSRVATLSRDLDGRKACGYLGRCLTGCPTDSLWTPRLELEACRRSPRFDYRPGRRVRRFRADADGTVRSIECVRIDDGGVETIEVEALALGAGTMATGKIFLESWARRTGERPPLTGLMDNRQVLMPFLSWRMIGRAHDPDTYQYHQLALGLEGTDPRDYVHGIVTTLKTASIHPIVPSVPFDLRTGLDVFRNVHAALGLVNVNFADRRRPDCRLRLEEGGTGEGREPALVAEYAAPRGEAERIVRATRRVARALRRLGAIVPPGMTHVRPMGASVHYAGTLPMVREGGRFTTTPEGRSRDFPNLWIVDGSTFPFLPAKNLTFTLMANAVRMAEAIPAGAA